MYAIESKVWALAKEAVRGTAEAAPTRFMAVDKSSEIEYKPEFKEDEQLRGTKARLAPQITKMVGTGKWGFYAEPASLGNFLLSLFGQVTSAQQGGTPCYKHTFSKLTTLQHPGHTFFADRGISVKKYNLCTVKQLTLNQPAGDILHVDTDFLCKSAATAAAISPIWTNPAPFSFNQLDVKIATVSDVDVKDVSLAVDNGAFALWAFNQSRDLSDILVKDKIKISGSFTIYFNSETERAKFLAGTATTLNLIWTGPQISGAYYNKIDANLYDVRYKAYPYTDADGILASVVNFEGYYSIDNSKDLVIDLYNEVASY